MASTVPTADRLAAEAYTQAETYRKILETQIARLNILAGVWPSQSNFSAPDLDVSDIYSALSALGTGAATTLPETLTVPEIPVLPTITPVQADNVTISVPRARLPDAPNIVAPVKPVVPYTGFTGAAPTINLPTTPERPVVELPAAPSFVNVSIPSLSDVALPSFIAVGPEDDLTAPTNLFDFEEVEYTSGLRRDLTARLREDFDRTTPTAYGIDDTDELRLFNREVDRQLRAAAIASAEITRQTAARGFSSPPGALMTQLADVQKAGLEKLSAASSEVYQKRADMYRENRRWVFERLTDVEKANLAYHLNVMERALNAAKISADVGISIYNSRVARFQALVGSYQASISGYEAQVRGALGAVEAQKLKLEAAQTEVGIQKNQVELYLAQVGGAKALMEMFQTDVAAMNGLIQVEALKLQAFKSQVEVYTEQLKSGTLQVQMYESQWRGEQIKADVYKTQVEAQNSIMGIAKTQADIAATNVNMRVEAVKSQVAVMQGTVEAYRAQAAGVASANQSTNASFAARTEAYRSLSSVYSGIGNIKIGEFDARLRSSIAQMQDSTTRTKIGVDLDLGATTTAADSAGKALQGMLNQVISIASTVSNSA